MTAAARPEPVLLEFVLPLPPNLGNARLHWAAKHRAKKKYWEHLDALVTARRLPRPPRLCWPRAELEVRLCTANRMDDDNAEARLKFAIDWLVTRGYVLGDGPEQIIRRERLTQLRVPRANACLYFRLRRA